MVFFLKSVDGLGHFEASNWASMGPTSNDHNTDESARSSGPRRHLLDNILVAHEGIDAIRQASVKQR